MRRSGSPVGRAETFLQPCRHILSALTQEAPVNLSRNVARKVCTAVTALAALAGFSGIATAQSARDFVTTFGFAGPVGLVADNYLGMFIRKALGDKDHAQFSAARGADGSIEELLEWVDAQPSLTDAQIWETWDESDGPRPESITKAYAYRMSRLRALREMLAFTLHDRSNDDRDDAEVLSAAARINTLSFWKNPRVGQRKK